MRIHIDRRDLWITDVIYNCTRIRINASRPGKNNDPILRSHKVNASIPRIEIHQKLSETETDSYFSLLSVLLSSRGFIGPNNREIRVRFTAIRIPPSLLDTQSLSSNIQIVLDRKRN